ncbi:MULTISPECIES: BON domain-containing protein [Nostocales]|uniref:BON domain-containing protein n=3 Tax=Nostocales TaxID=1161 RepID=A0A8S9TLR3_9CYAN|nr:BON domain-containing protein [Tolypothrix bouteillei]KAF3891313.1 BON domain-containing protein [Tolypothrix bouteillei VB521301]
MGWLQRLFGLEKPENAQTNPVPVETSPDGGEIPPERVGLNGEYDQSGLAKRVALAFDQNSELSEIETLWVAQTGSTVVLKGSVPNQDILDTIVSVASGVSGATDVTTDQVSVG